MERTNGRNLRERKTMLACMEFISRHINDEELFFETWLSNGMPDSEINYENLFVNFTEEADLIEDFYASEETFEEIMTCFLHEMYRAYLEKSGLYCDSCLSRE